MHNIFSKRTFRGLWLFVLISFVGGLFALKAELVLKLESLLSDKSVDIWVTCGLIFLSLSGTTFAYVLMSNRKRFIATKSYVTAGALQFVITYGAVYFATLIGLWLHGVISVQGLRFSITSIDGAILLYSSFLYPILKIAYDYLGIILDDGIDFHKFHRSSSAFLDRFDMNCTSEFQGDRETEIGIIYGQLQVMESELHNVTSNHPISDQDASMKKTDLHIEALIKFFKEYDDKPNQRRPDMDALLSGSNTHSDIRIQKSLDAVQGIREMKRLW